MKKTKLVYVEWLDHHGGGSGWIDREDIEELDQPKLCKSVGWLVRETDDVVVLAQTVLDDCACEGYHQVANTFTILKKVIAKRKEVKI